MPLKVSAPAAECVGRTGQGWLQMRPGCWPRGCLQWLRSVVCPGHGRAWACQEAKAGPGKRAPGAAGQPRVGATGQAGAAYRSARRPGRPRCGRATLPRARGPGFQAFLTCRASGWGQTRIPVGVGGALGAVGSRAAWLLALALALGFTRGLTSELCPAQPPPSLRARPSPPSPGHQMAL